MAATLRRAPAPGVEWEFERITIARDYPRSVVTKMLVERAEHGGWELDRVRVAPDGTRPPGRCCGSAISLSSV